MAIPPITANVDVASRGATQGDVNMQGAVINSGIGSPWWFSQAQSPAGSNASPSGSFAIPNWVLYSGAGLIVVVLFVAVVRKK